MSKRVAGLPLRSVAAAGLILGSVSLSGCTTLGGSGFGDVTGSTGQRPGSIGQQSMPQKLQPVTRVAEGQFIPPENIGGGGSNTLVTGPAPQMTGSFQSETVTTTSLPPLTGSSTKMSALPSLAPASPSRTASLGAIPTQPIALAPNTPKTLSVVPGNAYVHVIANGESMYTIARHYDVTAQAIVEANGMSSPDRITVGQKLIIPGRADLLAAKDNGAQKATQVASLGPTTLSAKPSLVTPTAPPAMPHALAPKQGVAPLPQASSAAITDSKLVDPTTSKVQPMPQKVATAEPAPKVNHVEPVMSGADKFRWPVSGRVTTDFSASKGTGINIDAPDGAAVRAAENGQVIYAGSGVEGYGNLILIRHPNGYVSAYAHLKSIGVSKGDNVSRGDNIGAVGMTGSVSSPQLHFELRKGATPVDPVPLLAG
jgi:murein DD-endopeptidase MepM/ murein hydrolase activator NlpD